MSVMAPAAERAAPPDSAAGSMAAGGGPAAEPTGPECTYEVVIKRLIIRDAPSTGGGIVHVLRQGERVTGTPCVRGGVPWLRLSRETLRTHEHAEVFAGEGSAWAMIDATESGLGLGQLLVRVPAELGWRRASESKRARSEVWEVVDRVGLVVSKETETSSAVEPERLSAGALVKALESVGERLRYQILTGTGPEKGWVNTRAGARELLVRVSNMPAGATDGAGIAPEPGDAAAADGRAAVEDPGRVSEVLLQYGKQFGKARDSDSLIFSRQSFSLWPGDDEAEAAAAAAPQAAMRAELERDLGLAAPTSDVAKAGGEDMKPDGATSAASTEDKDTDDDAWDASAESDPDSEDSDLEAVLCCPKCTLPVGELAYASPGSGACVHGECIAQLMLKEMRAAEEERLEKEARKKQLRRKEYDIGWTVGRIPSNVKPVARLTGGKLATPEGGMCRLVLQESDRRVRVAATMDPATSVNLEYLSIALKVRCHEGREPLFSLDPVDPALPESMQVKRFEPHWLKGTSVGDVLFEADYHLKELSMGEYPQPITGMKSCFDLSEEEGRDKGWAARQWFVVRKANVQLSQDGTLIPVCKMGVEAREQIVNSKGELQDLKMTRQDHPMVKFAESFTQNFDLIAERKSVIFHLRELARASILAKYLVESGAALDRSWLGLYSETARPCRLEIPQLWNDRCYSQIQVLDGKIVNEAEGMGTHSVYGGVQFGLNRFPSAAVSARGMAMSKRGMVPSRVPGRAYLAPAARMSSAMWAPAPHMVGPNARGVDLNLNRFDLAAHTKVTREALAASGDAPEACVAVGQAFWPHLDGGDTSAFDEKDRALLRDVFHPKLSDRRSEGSLFVPPDPSFAYVQKLRSLVQEEEKVRQQRKSHFYSAKFATSEPGRLFPASWSEAFEVAHGKTPAKSLPPSGSLHPRPDYKAQEGLLDIVTRATAPAFERSTEDGTVFRIYRLGSLELRTSQEHGEPEDLGAVFATSASAGEAPPAPEQEHDPREREQVTKITEYVEGNPEGGKGVSYRFYVVLETARGDTVVTEQLGSGAVTWEVNPPNLNQRNSLAKVYRSVLQTDKVEGIRLKDMRWCRSSHAGAAASQSARRRYAHAAYKWARGEDHTASSRGPAARSHPALTAVAAQQQSELQMLLGLGDKAMAGSRIARAL